MSWVTTVHTKRRGTSSSAAARAENLQVRSGTSKSQRQARHRHVERHELPREVDPARAGGVVLEAAGVAHQRRVEGHRGVVGEW
jgi:hypothetical protein